MNTLITSAINPLLRLARLRLTRETLPWQRDGVNGILRNVGLRLTRVLDAIDLADLADMVGRDAKTVLDVGANDGGDTLRLLNIFPQATVHAFEPEPRAVTLFRQKVTDSRGMLHELALGAENGTAKFYRSGGAPEGRESEFPQGWHASGSIRPPKEATTVHPWMKFDSQIQVPLMTLDTWAQTTKIDRIDFLWADVQGAEVDLIRGGTETLRRTRYFYTEYSNLEQYEGQLGITQLLQLLPGWSVQEQWPGDVLLRNTRFTK